MTISMSGIDHVTAPLSVREKFGLSQAEASRLVSEISKDSRISGCAVLATCNRTEIYLSMPEDTADAPAELLCSALGAGEHAERFVTRRGDEAASYLAQLACGLHSRIWGEDQILSQVKKAIEISRGAGCADPVLETLFRTCVSAGKEARGTVRLRGVAGSAAECAVEKLREICGRLDGKRALVIGNGEMGRLSARLLREAGCEVTVTLRSYRHGETLIPAGCGVAPYGERFSAMSGRDIVVSATTSPHFTVLAEDFRKVEKIPAYMVDLAVPRDIAPEIGDMPGVTLLNIDDLGEGLADREIPEQMGEIIERHLLRFRQWRDYREYLNAGPKFPMFMDIAGKLAVVVGGGQIGLRRAKTLRAFGADVLVIAPEIAGEPEGMHWRPREYREGDLQGALLVVAATNDRGVNRAVGAHARELGIPVSVADSRDECSFFFPAVCLGEGVAAGVVGDGNDHRKTVRAAKAVREALEGFS